MRSSASTTTWYSSSGRHDVAIEQARPVLVGDAQGVAKAARRDQQRRLALAFEQRVGGHRGAHLHALDLIRRDRLIGAQAQQVADAGNRRVLVVLRVVGQQLVRDQRAIGPAPDDVGERAAAVDPELPASVAGDRYRSWRWSDVMIGMFRFKVRWRPGPPGRTGPTWCAGCARHRRCRCSSRASRLSIRHSSRTSRYLAITASPFGVGAYSTSLPTFSAWTRSAATSFFSA